MYSLKFVLVLTNRYLEDRFIKFTLKGVAVVFSICIPIYKYMDTLVENVDDFDPTKEGIKFNIETKYKIREEIIVYGNSHPRGTIISGIRYGMT